MKKLEIDEKDSGKRLDVYLKDFFSDKGVSRGEIIRRIRSGDFVMDSGPVKPSHVLKAGDGIIIKSEPTWEAAGLLPDRKIDIPVIWEDENLLVIDKPSGIRVHPDAHERSKSVANWLVAKYPHIIHIHDGSEGAELRPGIVHRLDKDTSGIMVIAKKPAIFEELKRLFRSRQLEKTYLAVVYGQPDKPSGIIDRPIAKAASHKKQIIATNRTRTNTKSAVTEYRVIKKYQGFSLIEAKPKTGRTHQIRIHLWSIGHPVVGDALYKPKFEKYAELKAKRQLLHSSRIEFSLNGKKYRFEASLPADFRAWIRSFSPGHEY